MSGTTLLNLMFSKDEITKPCFKLRKLEPIKSHEHYIELGTNHTNNHTLEQDVIEEKQLTETDKLEVNFSPNDKKISTEKEGADRSFFETGIILDKVGKPTKETEGNISQYYMKTKVNDSLAVESPSKYTYSTNRLRKMKLIDRQGKATCKQLGKPCTLIDDVIPNIEWTAVSKKILRGFILSWCKTGKNNNLVEVIPSELDISKEQDKEITNLDITKFTDSSTKNLSLKILPPKENLDTLDDRTNHENSITFEKNTSVVESVNYTNLRFIRANPIFKNCDAELYRNWYIFLDSINNNALLVFKKDSSSEKMSLIKECSTYDQDSTDIISQNINKEPHQMEQQYKSIIRYGETVQRSQLCCKNNVRKDSFALRSSSIGQKKYIASTDETIDGPLQDASSDYNTLKSDIPTTSQQKIFSNINYVSSAEFDRDSFNQSEDEFMEAASNNGYPNKTIKMLEMTPAMKKSSTSIPMSCRKVRFSSCDDSWSIKTFEEKFNYWLESHLKELEENACLKDHDPCSNKDLADTCSVYLYKNLLQQNTSDWRNEYVDSLLDPSNKREKLINFKEIQQYFEKYWCHFRTNPPSLALLPSSVMLRIEKNFINDSIRLHQRNTIESICNEQFKTSEPCPCNMETDRNSLKISDDKCSNRLNNSPVNHSFMNISNEDKASGNTVKQEMTKPQLQSTLYYKCKKSSSFDSAEDEEYSSFEKDDTVVSLWENNKN